MCLQFCWSLSGLLFVPFWLLYLSKKDWTNGKNGFRFMCLPNKTNILLKHCWISISQLCLTFLLLYFPNKTELMARKVLGYFGLQTRPNCYKNSSNFAQSAVVHLLVTLASKQNCTKHRDVYRLLCLRNKTSLLLTFCWTLWWSLIATFWLLCLLNKTELMVGRF